MNEPVTEQFDRSEPSTPDNPEGFWLVTVLVEGAPVQDGGLSIITGASLVGPCTEPEATAVVTETYIKSHPATQGWKAPQIKVYVVSLETIATMTVWAERQRTKS